MVAGRAVSERTEGGRPRRRIWHASCSAAAAAPSVRVAVAMAQELRQQHGRCRRHVARHLCQTGVGEADLIFCPSSVSHSRIVHARRGRDMHACIRSVVTLSTTGWPSYTMNDGCDAVWTRAKAAMATHRVLRQGSVPLMQVARLAKPLLITLVHLLYRMNYDL